MYFFRRTLQAVSSSRTVKFLLAAAIFAFGWSASAAAQTFTEFPIPPPGGSPGPITTGPDGALWFTQANAIGRITTAGAITEFTVPTAHSDPLGITAGPDGAEWFTESDGNKIGRITTAGAITEFRIPTANSAPPRHHDGAGRRAVVHRMGPQR